jgi:hypothetical protein
VIEMDSMAIAMILSQQAQRAAWSAAPPALVEVTRNGAVKVVRPTRRGGRRRFSLALGHWPYPAH